MLLTEEEAKWKWCPQAHDGSDQRCVVSHCMAWRWDLPKEFEKLKRESENKPHKSPHQKGWKGFCGLAGRVK